MTKEQFKQFLCNTKVYVGKHGKEIIEKALECGYSWRDLKNNHYNYVVNNCPFLYFEDNLKMVGISTISIFTDKDEYEEITAEKILSIEIKEKVKQINLKEYAKRFKPFDKVICCDDGDLWLPYFYSHFVNDNDTYYPFRAIGLMVSYCLPYEGNEDLINTIFDKEEYTKRISQL